MQIGTVLSFVAASMLLSITPGPDILYVMTQSISQGKKAGIATALGLSTGLIVHTAAAALGVSAILQQSAVAFRILKYAGALYLFYLAWKALREKTAFALDAANTAKDGAALYRQGILMNILNPKVGLFFLAFLPQFVNSAAGNVPGQMIVLGLIFMLQTIVIFSLVALFSGAIGQKLLGRPRVAKYIGYAKASVFALIGIKLALSER